MTAFYVCIGYRVCNVADSYEKAETQGKRLMKRSNTKIVFGIAVSDKQLQIGDKVRYTHNLYEVEGCKYLLDFAERI